MSQHGLGLKKGGKKRNIDPVFNNSNMTVVVAKRNWPEKENRPLGPRATKLNKPPLNKPQGIYSGV
jgi:hypothetical protein